MSVGPAVVALGGGHGLSTTLRAVRRYARTVTAVVSVADNGGSSGRLRDTFGIPAPGDLRKCFAALGDPALPLTEAIETRFSAGDLAGHPLGNILIAGLTEAIGSFTAALEEVGRMVGVQGRVLPATLDAVVLKAESASGEVEGQVAGANADRITCVSLVPPDPAAPDEVVAAIVAADQVVLGPGSLFTSVLAVTAVPAIRKALATTAAHKIYICNLREQPPETTGFDVAAHIDALHAHGVMPDVVLFDPDALALGDCQIAVVAAPVADLSRGVHDPGKLATVLARLVG
ncbi:MAG: gluconeogenesis factor YvcK family protein [Acidimicrobiales bacterium]